MEHIAALLLLVGCSDDLASCKELPAPAAIYETAEECEAELQVSYKPYVGEYPQLFAQCVAVDPASEEEDAELVWDVRQDGTLVAAVGNPDILVASQSQKGDRVGTAQQ